MIMQPSGAIKDAFIPLVVGVTGHRDLRAEDLAGLENSVRSVFEDLDRKYPSTPRVILSPLAEGADRLVAKVALECGAQLVAALPMDQAEYETDFQSAESIAEFRELLGRASCVISLPCHKDQSREEAYATVGTFIAQESHILLALWDGETPKQKTVGTARVVDFKLHGIPKPYVANIDILSPEDDGPVYHILTPRKKNEQVSGNPYNLKKRFPHGYNNDQDAEDTYQKIYQDIDRVNCDSIRLAPKIFERKEQEQLLSPAQSSLVTSDEQVLAERFSCASSLAMHFQTKHKRTLVSLFGLAILAFSFIEFHVHVLSSAYILAGYPITLIITWRIYRHAKENNHQEKYLDYRALAEGLRVQFYWLVAGLQDDVADYYLRKQKSELDWIRNAIRACNFAARNTNETFSPEMQRARLQFVADEWVTGQLQYFIKVTDRDQKESLKQERLVKGLFWTGCFLSALVVAIDLATHPKGPIGEIRHLLIIAMGLSPAIAAALDGFAEKSAFAAQAKKYRLMREIFERAEKRLAEFLAADNLHGARELIQELGKEALAENGEWVLMHRDRPLHLPHAG